MEKWYWECDNKVGEFCSKYSKGRLSKEIFIQKEGVYIWSVACMSSPPHSQNLYNICKITFYKIKT